MLSIKVSLLEHRAGERRMEIGSGEVKRRYSAGSNPFPLQCQLLLLVQVKICLPVTGDAQSPSTSMLWENVCSVMVPPET